MNPNNINIRLPRVNPLRRTGGQNHHHHHIGLQGVQTPPRVNANQNQQLNLFNTPPQANHHIGLQGVQTPPRVNVNQNQQLNLFNTPPQVPHNRNHLINAPEVIHARNFRDERFANAFIPDEERLINEEANRIRVGNILERVINVQNNPALIDVAILLRQAINNNQINALNLPDNYVQRLMDEEIYCILSGYNIEYFRQNNINIVLLRTNNIYHLFAAESLITLIRTNIQDNNYPSNPFTRSRIIVGDIVNPMSVNPNDIR